MSESFHFTNDFLGKNTIFWKLHLNELCGQPNLRFLEIGSYEGRSAIWMLSNILTHPSSRIDCVDSFYNFPDNYEQRFDYNILLSGFSKKVAKFKGDSKVLLRELPMSTYDCIFIDGGHTSVDVIQDAVLSFLLLRPNGFLIFDDYFWKPQMDPLLTPKKAIDAFLDIYKNNYILLRKNYQVIIRKV